MPLKEEFEKAGNRLFRRRSYLPLFSIVLFVLAFRHFSYPLGSHRLDQLWEIICLLISSFGLIIRALTAGYALRGTSGRNTAKGQRADVLNTTGMYSILRHPLYVGNFVILLGISLFLRLWWFSLVYMLLFFLYYERIMFAEEEYLRKKFGATYLDWANKTPAFFPKFANWQRPQLSFSFRTVLKREYLTFFGIISAFALLEVVGDWVVEGRFELDWMWLIIFTVSLAIFLTIRILRKKTKILHVHGR
ncbi:MAG: isoprenylcysteine carboxylmethyltransferase family protein [Thermodesulfobacteriota bacterium]